MKRRFLTEADDEFIRSNYSSMSHRSIAEHLGIAISTVRSRGGRLGLRGRVKKWSEADDKMILSLHGTCTQKEVADRLGRSSRSIMERSKHLSIPKWRRPSGMHAGRQIDGFNKGRPVYTHRVVMAKHIGRSLTRQDVVHHIDCDTNNNSIENLHLFNGPSPHRLAHLSIERLIKPLLDRGAIMFDRDDGVYRISK